jgi:hypothetical protein
MKRYFTLITLIALAAIAVGCSGDDAPADLGSTDPVDPAEVNKFVNGLPDWTPPSNVEEPPVDLGDSENLEDSQYYRCTNVEYDLRENFDDILAVGANATALKPGMIVQGNGVKDGSFSTIGLARSPIELSVNLALEDPSRTVQNPTSATIQDAIASLQREADDRLSDLDVIPTRINFKSVSAYSVKQAMLQAGLSVKYNAVLANGSVSGSLDQSSSVKTRTVLVKLLQPMYTISFADDAKAEPADFFSPDLIDADFKAQQQLGTMGPGNLPCYVQSVTYGRMIVYSMTSTEAVSDEEYRLAVQASYGAWEGSGNVNTRQQELVQNSTVEVQVFGGLQGATLNAIKTALKNGDFSEFLTPAPATTAVPLSYRVNDLKNRQAATVGDATKFSVRQCEPVNDLKFTVTLDRIDIVAGCEPETSFDIECFVWTRDPSSNYVLIHVTPPDYRFYKEDLPGLGGQTIFTITASQATTLTIDTNVVSTSGTGLDSWNKSTTFNFPFDQGDNPYSFSHLETVTDDRFNNCTMELHYTIKRELAQP